MWLFVLCFLVLGCKTSKPPSVDLVHRSQPLLGTFVTISVYDPDRARADAAISAAFDEIRRIDGIMSLHRPDSELNELNKNAARRPVKVSRELFDVIARAQHIAHETEGSFDITIRPLADLWGFIWKEYRLPSSQELNLVLPHVDHRQVVLNSSDNSIRFLRDGVSIDLGGIGKGYAVDCALDKILSLGVTTAMVKAGGDLRVVGAPPGEEYWIVQIEDPQKKRKRISIPLRDAALSTSGHYENFFEVNGTRYSHILNPRSGLPVSGVAACSVIAGTCTESDAWATALFVYGEEKSFAKFGERLGIRYTTVSAKNKLQTRQNHLFPQP